MKRHAITAASATIAMCVAAGTRANAPPGRYTISSGTVYDTKTKLTWERIAPASASNFTSATSHCLQLSLNGVAGWRVPTVKELATLLDATQLYPVDLSAFPGTNGSFWSSTPVYGPPPPYVWTIDLSTPFDTMAGDTTPADVATGKFVRCVR